jgi:dolichol-phosphate mannosyltransferase
MLKIAVVIPTYNEAENLPELCAALFKLPLPGRGEVLVVDDNSPDGTGRVAEELARSLDGRLKVVHRPHKLGLGTAYVLGFRRVLAEGADVVVQMDADFSHDPAYLVPMVGLSRDYDVVVGSRWVRGGQVDPRWGFLRRVLSRWGGIYARLILGLRVADPTTGFKVFRGDALARIPLDRVVSNGYAFQVEMAYLCQLAGLRVCEYPIIFNDRTRGRSKMTAGIALEAAWRVLEIKWRNRKAVPPTKPTS